MGAAYMFLAPECLQVENVLAKRRGQTPHPCVLLERRIHQIAPRLINLSSSFIEPLPRKVVNE